MPDRGRPGRRILPRLGLLAIVVLTAADIALVTRAFDHVNRPADGADRVSGSAGAGSAARDRRAGQAPVSSVLEEPDLLPAGALHLALAPDGTVLIGAVGGCAETGGAPADGPAESPIVLVAPDPAHEPRAVEVAEGLTAVLGLDAGARDDLTVIGTGPTCQVRAFEGTFRGSPWAPLAARDRWYVDPSGEVHAPGGAVEVPCSPAGLSTTGSVRLLCDDGALLGTPDVGESWVALGRVDRASAFAFDGASAGVALVETDGCAVAVTTTANGGAGWRTVGCLDGEPGRAVAKRGDDVVAVVGDTLWHSADGGETWDSRTG